MTTDDSSRLLDLQQRQIPREVAQMVAHSKPAPDAELEARLRSIDDALRDLRRKVTEKEARIQQMENDEELPFDPGTEAALQRAEKAEADLAAARAEIGKLQRVVETADALRECVYWASPASTYDYDIARAALAQERKP